MKIKDDFYYEQNGHIWNNFSEDEKKDLLIAYEESFDKGNLLSHEEVKQQRDALKSTYFLTISPPSEIEHPEIEIRIRNKILS